jgi:site-specific DNA recombinase
VITSNPNVVAARAAIYTRVSTDEQAEHGYSLGEQARRGAALIEREGWQHVGTYEDAGLSGSDANRPAYRRLLDDVAAGLIDVVVVVALDRFGRDAGELRSALTLLDAAGVRFVSEREHTDRSTPEGRLQHGILAEFAEFEREKIRARSKAGIGARAREGKRAWGPAAYGYAKGEDGHWAAEPAEAEVARRIFRLRVEGAYSYQRIATTLNRERVPTRSRGNWTATMVRKVLTGRYVRGYFWHGGEWIKGRHAPIVDEDAWLAAQVLAERGARFAPSRAGRRPPRHLFTGALLRCAACGEAMLPRSNPDVYVCRSNWQLLGAGGCPMGVQRRADVDGRFLALFEAEFLDLDATRKHVAAELNRRSRDVGAQLTAADAEVAKLEAKLARAERDYDEEQITGSTYERLTSRYLEERAAAVRERDRLANHAADVSRTLENLDAEEETLQRLAALRDSVAAHARDAAENEDIITLRGVVAEAFGNVYLGVDGEIEGMTPAGRMELRGDELHMGGIGVVRMTADGQGELDIVGHAIPFRAAATNVTGSGVPE